MQTCRDEQLRLAAGKPLNLSVGAVGYESMSTIPENSILMPSYGFSLSY